MKILSVLGTRPEVVKMAPILGALARDRRAVSRVCVTGQHRSMLDELLPVFDIHPDLDLGIMRPSQTLSEVLAAAVTGLERVLRDRDARRLESVQAEVRARVSACVERARDDVPLPVEEFVERAARW